MDIFYTKEFWYFFIPVILSVVIYFLSKNTNAERNHLLILFKANQRLSKKIQEELEKFIEEFNASNAIAFPERNITYGTWLELMSEEYKSYLSDERYDSVRKMKVSKPALLSMIDSLNKQNEALRLLEIDMNLVTKKAKEA